jgi:hypothetical protein
MSGDWYCRIADRESGPLSSDEIRFLVERGKLAIKDEVRQGKEGAWKTIDSIAELEKLIYSSRRTATGNSPPGPDAIATERVQLPPRPVSPVSDDYIVSARKSSRLQGKRPPAVRHLQKNSSPNDENVLRKVAIGAGIVGGLFFILLLLLIFLLWLFSSGGVGSGSGGGLGTGNGTGIGSGTGSGEGSGSGSGKGAGSGQEIGDGSGQGSPGDASSSSADTNSTSQNQPAPQEPQPLNTQTQPSQPDEPQEPPKKVPPISLFMDPQLANPSPAPTTASKGGRGGGGGGGKKELSDAFKIDKKVKSVVFVIDRSSSMAGTNTSIVDIVKDRSNSISQNKLERVKAELIRAIDALDETQRFSVIFFNQDFMPMPSSMSKAGKLKLMNARNKEKQEAKEWISKVLPEGGTIPFPAMELAISAKPDLIVLLSDGEFAQDQVENILNDNRLRGKAKPKPINCIGLSENPRTLEEIANQSGGVYIFVK